jgi:hypothetical protein
MPPIDDLMNFDQAWRITWPMEPTKMLMSMGKLDLELYTRIYEAQVEYLEACAEAQKTLGRKILESLKETKLR